MKAALRYQRFGTAGAKSVVITAIYLALAGFLAGENTQRGQRKHYCIILLFYTKQFKVLKTMAATSDS